MLTIRVTGAKRQLVGWSLQEAAARSGVNWLTIRKYEGAGDYHPRASVGALDRLVSAYEANGVRFDTDDGVCLERPTSIASATLHEGAAA